MSDAMLRSAEAVALDVTDIDEQGDGSGRVMIQRSKTDQDSTGTVLYLGPATMRRVAAWLNAAGHTAGPLFRSVRRGGHVANTRLGVRSVSTIIASRAAAAGIDGDKISGHSLRVGAAQALAERGAGVVEMQEAGRWKSPEMLARYAAGSLTGRGAVARLRHGRSD